MRTHLVYIIFLSLVSCGFTADPLEDGFRSPPREYRPETWFHIIGNNITKEGLTKDLEAIKYSGIRGIQLFNKSGGRYPGVPQVKILSPEWKALIRHAADECKRLGLSFTLQNCPGWSLAGGPWVPVEEAQRELVQAVFRVKGGKPFDGVLLVDKKFTGNDYDYKDICVTAFPTPKDDELAPFVPVEIRSNNKNVPWERIFDPSKKLRMRPRRNTKKGVRYDNPTIGKVGGEPCWVHVRFAKPVTLRAIRLPPLRQTVTHHEYPIIDVRLLIETVENGKRVKVVLKQIPVCCWQDRRVPLTLAIPETRSQEIRITFQGRHVLQLPFFRFLGHPRLDNWQAKAGFVCRSLEHMPTMKFSSECALKADAVIDLSGKMDTSGKLKWTPPAGDWTVVRFGHVNMRLMNGPAVPEARGWECSKLDKAAVENHLRKGMIGELARPGGPCGDGKLYGLLIDSWEKYVQTWTMKSDTLFREFKKRRGYDLRPFMPALMGYIIRDQRYTERFLRDLRETMDDLYVQNFFETFTKIGHEFGATTYVEGASGEVLPGDPLRYYGVTDVPMTEFWFPHPPSAQNRDGKPVGCAASAAHLYNKQRVAAEACTQLGVKWTEHPFSVKYLIDHNFTLGVNHIVFHTFTHTPQSNVYPGSSFGGGIGFPLVRGQTWWRHTPAWINYLTRCQYLLQRGEYVADVLWYLGDELERAPAQDTPFPEGYRFDHLNPEVLHTLLSIRDGKIHVKNGGDYRIIWLRNSRRMLRSTAERLKQLVMAGAVILGDKPVESPSLMDDAKDLAALNAIANELWGNGESGVKRVGKGKVYWGKPLETVLREERIDRDVNVPGDARIAWIHRQIDGADVYFLSNQDSNTVDLSVAFRITGKMPELWDPHTGNTQPAGVWQQSAGQTNVALRFPSNGSAIVVFRAKPTRPGVTRVVRNGQTVLDSSPGWMSVNASRIRVVRALYGVVDNPGRRVNVTAKIQKLIDAGAASVKGINSLAGDPAEGMRKEFLLEYIVNGKTVKRKVRENESIELGSEPTGNRTKVCDISPKSLTAWEPGDYVLSLSDGTTRRITVKPKQQKIEGPWKVDFEKGWDTPSSIEFPRLASLTDHRDKTIQHYSGTVTYRKSINVAATGKPVTLDLGEVHDIAEVWCNGKKVGTRWCPPFRFDLSKFAQQGRNELVIKVTNTWRNQLIYDLSRSKGNKKTWTTNPPRSSNERLTPSGLIGPVKVTTGSRHDLFTY